MISKYNALLDYYQQGIYTNAEVLNVTIDLLLQSNNREEFWSSLRVEHREKIAKILKEFDESAEPFAVNADPIKIWQDMSKLKKWFMARLQ